MQGHCWESKTRFIFPPLCSQSHLSQRPCSPTEVFGSSPIPPGKAIRGESVQPLWSLLWHLQPIRYKTLKKSVSQGREPLNCPQALPCVSARLPRCHSHPIPIRDLLYQVDLPDRAWFPRDFTSMCTPGCMFENLIFPKLWRFIHCYARRAHSLPSSILFPPSPPSPLQPSQPGMLKWAEFFTMRGEKFF